MAGLTLDYNELLRTMKYDEVNLPALYNTKAKKNGTSQTSTFQIRNGAIVLRGAGAHGVCNSIPQTCGSGTSFEVTANYALSMNHKENDCDFMLLSQTEKMELFSNALRDWALTELTYVESEQNKILVDMTPELLTENFVNWESRLMAMVKNLISQGYSSKDIVIQISESVAIDLAEDKWVCCDYNVQYQTQAEVSTNLARRLNIKGIYATPTNQISGYFEFEEDGVTANDPLVPELQVEAKAYIHELHMVKDYCVNNPEMRELKGENNAGVTTQIIGDEKIGFGAYGKEVPTNKLDSGVLCYKSLPAVPPII